jgi:tripartite-type tricarboxylate transporter receptor subunit TctC
MKKSIAIFFITAIGGVILGMFVSGEVFPGPAFAQEKYPSKPINLIVGYPAGGTTDLGARALAWQLARFWGSQW